MTVKDAQNDGQGYIISQRRRIFTLKVVTLRGAKVSLDVILSN